MTHLRNMMLEELQRRNYSQSTTRAYVRVVRELAAYFRQPPDRLGPDHLRQFQAHPFRERKLNARTVVQYDHAPQRRRQPKRPSPPGHARAVAAP